MAAQTAAFVSTPTITLDGTASASARDDLTALSVEETTAGMSWCEATFSNLGVSGYRYLSGNPIDFGTELAVSFGADEHPLFIGRVSALRADYPAAQPARLQVLAEDRLQELRLARRTRTFADSSTADIADQLASDHGLTADVSLDGPVRTVVAQLNQSDLAFLRQLARWDDGEVWLDGTTLHVRRRPDRGTDTLSLTYGADLVSFSVRADLAHQVSDVTVAGWSVADKGPIAETADDGDLAAELGSDQRSGSAVLASVFGARSERIVRSSPLAADDARAQARAAYLERARRFVCGTGIVAGNPALRVGVRVTLAGLGGLFDGDYLVCRARHEYDLAQGYRTEFDVERAGVGAGQ